MTLEELQAKLKAAPEGERGEVMRGIFEELVAMPHEDRVKELKELFSTPKMAAAGIYVLYSLWLRRMNRNGEMN